MAPRTLTQCTDGEDGSGGCDPYAPRFHLGQSRALKPNCRCNDQCTTNKRSLVEDEDEEFGGRPEPRTVTGNETILWQRDETVVWRYLSERANPQLTFNCGSTSTIQDVCVSPVHSQPHPAPSLTHIRACGSKICVSV
jgi:hypothetical protein